jgi:hypothetical protein
MNQQTSVRYSVCPQKASVLMGHNAILGFLRRCETCQLSQRGEAKLPNTLTISHIMRSAEMRD